MMVFALTVDNDRFGDDKMSICNQQQAMMNVSEQRKKYTQHSFKKRVSGWWCENGFSCAR